MSFWSGKPVVMDFKWSRDTRIWRNIHCVFMSVRRWMRIAQTDSHCMYIYIYISLFKLIQIQFKSSNILWWSVLSQLRCAILCRPLKLVWNLKLVTRYHECISKSHLVQRSIEIQNRIYNKWICFYIYILYYIIILYYIVLYYIVLYYIILYCIILYYILYIISYIAPAEPATKKMIATASETKIMWLVELLQCRTLLHYCKASLPIVSILSTCLYLYESKKRPYRYPKISLVAI